VNEATKDFILLRLFEIIDGMDTFNKCSLRLQECHTVNLCPLHQQMDDIKQKLKTALGRTSIGDLIREDKDDFIKSIATDPTLI
jgi:DNA-binding IscR family transcriptional regulator